ncbi:MAG: Fur family transcriptional regulator [Sneathiellaceae bacterium]
MDTNLQDRDLTAALRRVGLRPTRQRVALAQLLLQQGPRHVTAEALHAEADAIGIAVSLATVYNTLHQFTEAGLLRQVVVAQGRSYFDTNTADHHHFYFEDTGRLVDIDADQVAFDRLPDAPEGTDLNRIDVVIRLRKPARG